MRLISDWRGADGIPRAVHLLLLFLVVSAGFVLWRGSDFIVWDDTSSASFNRYSIGLHFSWSKPNFLVSLIQEEFGHIGGDGYRPFSAIVRGLGAAWFGRDEFEPLPFVLMTGILLGFWAVALWLLARRFTRFDLGADLVVFLNVVSVPVLTGSLVVSSGIQVAVPLFICVGLLLYARAKESRRAWVWYVLLSLVLVAGPWFREFAGVTPLLILAAEILRLFGRRQIAPLAIAGAGFAHSLFPTALVRLIAFPGLPVVPVYKMGNLAHALERTTAAAGPLASLARLHWRILGDIVSVLPPSLFLIGLVGLAVCAWRRDRLWLDRRIAFLTIFFLLTFLPFLKTFHEQVHLAYAIAPLAILLAILVERLWIQCEPSDSMRAAFAAAMFVVLGDHVVNLYSVRQVTRSIYAGIQRQADWLKANTPPGTVVICNALHVEDIRYYSHGHIRALSTAAGTPDPNSWVTDAKSLAAALVGLKVPVYCLDARLPNDGEQRGAVRANWVVDREALKMQFVHADRVLCRYPYLDPLRRFLPTRNLCWPGPPDLEFDFYRGRASNHHRFESEVSLEHRLYRVTDYQIKELAPPPALLAENVEGFNIIGYKNQVIAIPQSEGAFEQARVDRGAYSQVFRGHSVEEVAEMVRTAQRQGRQPGQWRHPTLLAENVGGFNIVGYNNAVVAIPQGEGAFEQERVDRGGYSRVYCGHSLEDVAELIRTSQSQVR